MEDKERAEKITMLDTAMDIQKFIDLHNKVNEIKKRFLDNTQETDYRNSKAGWGKIKTFFRFSHQIISSERIEYEKNGQKHIMWKYKVRIISPEGLFTEAEGICSTEETICKDNAEYVISDLAHTRAYNKAIADMIGIADIYTDIDSKEKMKQEERLESKGEVLETSFDRASNQTWIQGDTKIKREDSSSDKSLRIQLMKRMTELMNSKGMLSPQDKKDYSQKVLKRPLKSSSDLSIEDIKFITKMLEETP